MKCRYHKRCIHYDSNSKTCIKNRNNIYCGTYKTITIRIKEIKKAPKDSMLRSILNSKYRLGKPKCINCGSMKGKLIFDGFTEVFYCKKCGRNKTPLRKII